MEDDEVDELPRVSDYDDAPLDMQAKLAVMIDYRRKQIQQATVKRLNDLSQHNNGRVQASAADAETYLCCANDAAHGKGTVYIVIEGELFELCPDCGESAVQAKLRDAEVGDVIDVEVMR